ncbi:hypothetical protein ACLK1V_00540 [Escherichia coli]
MVVRPYLKYAHNAGHSSAYSANTDVNSWKRTARQAGMRTLFENGCLAVEQGLTTFEELIRVLAMPHGE